MFRSVMRTAMLLATAAAATTAANATALSTTYDYNFVSTNSSLTGGDNSRTYNVTVGGRTISVTATAWNATKITSGTNTGKYNYTQGWLGSYDGGLGVTSDGNDLDGEYGLHQIDNIGVVQSGSSYATVLSYDFVQLRFDTAVTLGGITRNSYGAPNASLSDYVYDNDFAWGALSSATTAGVKSALPGVTNVNVSGNCSSGTVCNSTSTIYTKTAADTTNVSNIWLVGASMNNLDGTDGFKLASIKAYYTAPVVIPPSGAVPEPATWAMMILGFALVGMGARRRRAGLAAAA